MSNIPTSTGGPNTAYSTTTWIIGAQTWTDRIIIPACNKNDLSSSSITPDCRSYNDSGMLRYYYNWPYVNANASALCPSPWRVPTQSDFNALVSNTNDSAMIGAWGYGGLTQGSSMSSVSSAAYYWSSTAGGTYGAYYLRYASDYLYVQNYVKNFGYQVRCVR
jgi:hypothetical protein